MRVNLMRKSRRYTKKDNVLRPKSFKQGPVYHPLLKILVYGMLVLIIMKLTLEFVK